MFYNKQNNNNEVATEYESALKELTFNSKPIINNLTIIAKENLNSHKQIIKVIENRITNVRPTTKNSGLKLEQEVSSLYKAKPQQKLPILYLLDSIVKNVGEPYIKEFANNIEYTFCRAFEKVKDETIKQSYLRLVKTWPQYFPPKKVTLIERTIRQVYKQMDFLPKKFIHVNPRFFNQSDVYKQSAIKQQSILVLLKKLEVELLKNPQNFKINRNVVVKVTELLKKHTLQNHTYQQQQHQLLIQNQLNRIKGMYNTHNQIQRQQQQSIIYQHINPYYQQQQQQQKAPSINPYIQQTNSSMYSNQNPMYSNYNQNHNNNQNSLRGSSNNNSIQGYAYSQQQQQQQPVHQSNNSTSRFINSSSFQHQRQQQQQQQQQEEELIPKANELVDTLKSLGFLHGTNNEPEKELEMFVQDAVTELYDGFKFKCSNCGRRFNLKNGLDRHLDMHFQNSRNSTDRIISRKWYQTEQGYIQKVDEKNYETPKSLFFPKLSKKLEISVKFNSFSSETIAISPVKKSQHTVIADDNQDSCPVCMDKFERYWDEIREEWMFREAVIDEKSQLITHAFCLPSLGKRKFEEMEIKSENESTHPPMKKLKN